MTTEYRSLATVVTDGSAVNRGSGPIGQAYAMEATSSAGSSGGVDTRCRSTLDYQDVDEIVEILIARV